MIGSTCVRTRRPLRAAARDWGFDPKSEMWRLPPMDVGPYAEQDALMTLKLWERLKIEVEKARPLGHMGTGNRAHSPHA